MKRHEVMPGGVYGMTVKGKPVQVRIEAARSNGGWDATNLATGKVFRFKNHQTLKPNPAAEEMVATEVAEMTPDSTPLQAKLSKSETPAKPKKISAIDAAAKVLGEAGTPMNTKQLVEAMTTKGYWTRPAGKTPAQTLYSAIIREIATKGESGRFSKTERGTFIARNTQAPEVVGSK